MSCWAAGTAGTAHGQNKHLFSTETKKVPTRRAPRYEVRLQNPMKQRDMAGLRLSPRGEARVSCWGRRTDEIKTSGQNPMKRRDEVNTARTKLDSRDYNV